MALTWIGLAALLAGCGERLEAGRPKALEEQAVTVVRGDGWAVRVPEGARVRSADGDLSVDAADDTWWYDVRIVPLDQPTDPMVTAARWADGRCHPVRWDIPAVPTPGTWTAGGFCTIGDRDHWLLVTQEDRGARRVLTGVIAQKRSVPYEDAWVLLTDSALTVTASGEPAPAVPAGDVRATLRRVQQGRQQGTEDAEQLPRPGGGTFSRAVSQALANELWRGRADHALPDHLGPVAPP